jgi:hypothetical protein
MKSLPLIITDKLLLNRRNKADTIIGNLKEFSAPSLLRHRSVANVFPRILTALTGYQLDPLNPQIPWLYAPHNPLSGLYYYLDEREAD